MPPLNQLLLAILYITLCALQCQALVPSPTRITSSSKILRPSRIASPTTLRIPPVSPPQSITRSISTPQVSSIRQSSTVSQISLGSQVSSAPIVPSASLISSASKISSASQVSALKSSSTSLVMSTTSQALPTTSLVPQSSSSNSQNITIPGCPTCNSLLILISSCSIRDVLTVTTNNAKCVCTQAFLDNYATCSSCLISATAPLQLTIPSSSLLVSSCPSVSGSGPDPPSSVTTGTNSSSLLVLPPFRYISTSPTVNGTSIPSPAVLTTAFVVIGGAQKLDGMQVWWSSILFGTVGLAMVWDF